MAAARPKRARLAPPSWATWMTAPGDVRDLTTRARWLAFAAFTVLVVIGWSGRRADHASALMLAGGAIAVAAGALLAQVRPRLVLPCAVAATAGVAMFGTGSASNLGWFALCGIAAWCVHAGGGRAGLAYWAGSLLLFGGEWLGHHDPGWGAWVGGVTLSAFAAFLVRHQFDLVDRLREAQAGLAERSRAEERNRIARELHDVIAHSLTVSLLHVTSARLAVEYEPAEAAQSLAEAERLCRQSLAEVRSTVGLLRQDADATGGPRPPVPGIDRVPELVGEFRGAGAGVSLRVDGDTGALPATVGSAIYRILQESLTNAAKHAPGSAVEVRLAVQPSAVNLQVDSSGRPGHGSGMGLLSMRERAEAVGGHCTAGPAGDGWTVRAELPHSAATRQDPP
jgi:signal transduction histidine kinase